MASFASVSQSTYTAVIIPNKKQWPTLVKKARIPLKRIAVYMIN